MADQELQQKFFSLLRKQRGFDALDEGQRNLLLQKFSVATDEQILQAVGVLKLLEDGGNVSSKLSSETEQHLAEEALQIRQEMKNIDREQLQINEAQDKESTDGDAEKLLKALEKIETPKKKKLFGVF